MKTFDLLTNKLRCFAVGDSIISRECLDFLSGMPRSSRDKFCAVLLLLLFTMGVGNVWGAEVSVSISTYASANSWTNDSKYGSVTIDANVTATTKTDSNNGKYWSNDDSWRFYHSESGKLTISTSSGTLNSVTLTFTTKDNGKISYGSTALTSGVARTVSGTSAEFVVGSTKESKGKIFITAISVTYTPAASSTKTLVFFELFGSGSKATQSQSIVGR